MGKSLFELGLSELMVSSNTDKLSKATVILTLSNEGYGRYNPKDREYASTIIIERVISRNGTNEYKLRATKDGKILGKKKSEVDAICSTFSLDVDQPMTILTQDQARTFLSSADDQQLYKVGCSSLFRV